MECQHSMGSNLNIDSVKLKSQHSIMTFQLNVHNFLSNPNTKSLEILIGEGKSVPKQDMYPPP